MNKQINKISPTTESAILRKSAYGLPLRPSASGMRSEDIKKAFYKSIIDNEDSVLSELKRIVIEANEIIGYLENKIETNFSNQSSHEINISNPHKVTKEQIGLGEVDNSSDQDKPVSKAQQTELDKKIEYVDIIDNLKTEMSRKPLSANQGFIIKNLIAQVEAKADVTIVNITMDEKGVITATKTNGEKIQIDLPIEFLVKSGYFDSKTKNLVLTLENNTTIFIPVQDLVNEYFADDSTITLYTTDGKLTFSLSATYKNKIDGIEKGAQKNVQSDWNQSDDTADDFIKNKPTIPEGVVVENNLTSESTTNSLSAKQGNVLHQKIGSSNSRIAALEEENDSAKNRITTLENDNTANKSSISALLIADEQNIKTTGDQSIEGTKNFIGSFQVNGGEINHSNGTFTINGRNIISSQPGNFVEVALYEGQYDGNTNAVGYIDFQVSATQKLRYYYGIINVEKSVSFPTPYSKILWATSVMQPSSDTNTYRATIKKVSNTGLTFKGGSTMATRWEAWGIINS